MCGSEEKLPEESGIYIVYKCAPGKKEGTVKLREILYIGQAENIKERHVPQHERFVDFMRECDLDENICYAWILVDRENLDRVENGLIYMQQPKLCDRGRQTFDYPETEFILKGKTGLFYKTEFVLSE